MPRDFKNYRTKEYWNERKNMKIGTICRADNSGLGNLAWEFCNHLPITKQLIVLNNVYHVYPERFKNAIVSRKSIPDRDEIDALLQDIDLLLLLETPFNWGAISKAKQRGIKVVLIPMYECTEERKELSDVDLFLCPSLLDYNVFPEPKYFLPIPINREKLKFKLRKKARVFTHHTGHGGIYGRNGTEEFLQAIKLVKSDVRFTIYTQYLKSVALPMDILKRVYVHKGNIKNYWDVWRDEDVFVFPHKWDGCSLPINEAMSVGMPIISTDMYPFNQYLPKDLLFKPKRMLTIQMARKISMADISPEVLAQKIDEIANTDISKYSIQGNQLAEKWSWENLLPKYMEIFQKVCSGEKISV